MRKIILYIAASLDNYIAGKGGEVDWLFTDGDYGFADFYNSIDTIVTGRKTYDKSIELGGANAFKGKKVIVFTHNKELMNDNDVEFVRSDIIAYTRKLKLESGKQIWLLGGGEIIKEFLLNGLVDEIDLAIHPIILGEGVPLFYSMPKQTNLKLTSHKIHENGLVQLRFNVLRD